MDQQKTYDVVGLSCANCANKFERKLNQLPSVEKATVNFGASKIYVTGDPTIEELNKAGAFENLDVKLETKTAVQTEEESATLNEKWWQKVIAFYHHHYPICFATLLVVLGYIAKYTAGETHLITILLFLTSILISGASLLIQGFKNLIHFEFDMHSLMTIAVVGGALIGEWGEVAVVVILFALSEALEAFTMNKARQSMKSLMSIAPDTAYRMNQQEIEEIPVEDIHVNDIIYIKPGQKVPLDGIIINGASSINQSAITGESIPVDKGQGDEVFAGTLNESGVLEVRVTKQSNETTLSKMIQLVEQAQVNQAPAQALIEKFAKYYTPIIIIIAVMVMILPPLLWQAEWHTWLYQGLSVLVIGCPCALVIATPIAIISSISNAAKQGVLIKGGIHLEQLSQVKAFIFDKTGTLTQGQPKVTHIEFDDELDNKDELLRQIGTIENMSDHPIARAIVTYIQDKALPLNEDVQKFYSLTGVGVSAKIQNASFMAAKPQYFETEMTPHWQERVKVYETQGHTVVLVSKETRIVALIAINDQIRPEAFNSCQKLLKLGVQHLEMLTGDNGQTAKAIAHEVGVTHFKAQQLPEDKQARVTSLQREYTHVAMIGDGVNDAPALAKANVGLSMGAASTDTAVETADIAILSDDLTKIPYTFRLSRLTMRIIKINILIAIGLKVAALLLVIPGWLTLWIAIFSDMGATLLVGLNAMRLLYIKP